MANPQVTESTIKSSPRYGVIESLAKMLGEVLANAGTKKRTNKDGKEVDSPAAATFNEEERKVATNTIISNPYLLQISSGQEEFLQAPEEGQEKLAHIKRLRENLRKAEKEFEDEFPEFREAMKFNTAAQEVLQAILRGMTSQKIPAGFLSAAQVFTGKPVAEGTDTESDDEETEDES